MTLPKLSLTPLFLAVLALPAVAADCVDPAMIKEGMAVLGSYSEVPSSVDCATAQSPGEKLICTIETLAKMAVIDDRAWIFAYEAKAETLVANPPLDDAWIATRNACTDESCVCDQLKTHTGASMGDLSPYIPD